jgi:hypothetical protein
VARAFDAAGLRVFDVQELPTHGGSLRVFGCHSSDARPQSESVQQLLLREEAFGLRSLDTYRGFQAEANRIKDDLLTFLIEQKRAGRRTVAYGAAAKGNTLLNYAGVKPDLLPFVCDAAPAKQNRFMPGSHIPILHPDAIAAYRPDIVLILPWNLSLEVRRQLSFISQWGGRFATAVPSMEVS